MRDKEPIRPEQTRFVFLDARGRRWPRMRLGMFVTGLAAAIALVIFVQALFVKPNLGAAPAVRKLKGQLKALSAPTPNPAVPPEDSNWMKFYPRTRVAQERLARLRAQIGTTRLSGTGKVRAAFIDDWSANSANSLAKNHQAITHLCPNWFTMTEDGSIHADEDDRIQRFTSSEGIALMPRLTNLDQDTWQPERVEQLANGTPMARASFIKDLMASLKGSRVNGVVVQWEEIDPSYKDGITELLSEMADALHSAQKELWVLMSVGDGMRQYDIDALSEKVDRFAILLTDENAETDKPGPVASQDWVEGWISVIEQFGNTDQWIGVLGTHGYDWASNQRRGELISYADAMSRASYAGLESASVTAPYYNGNYGYQEATGDHTVWFLDAIAFYNQFKAVREADFGGIGLARVGLEDPQIWDILQDPPGEKPAAKTINELSSLGASEDVTNVGKGEVITVDDEMDDGRRTITVNDKGYLEAVYKDFPTYPVIYHQGETDERRVAITFDDGPDPHWTPKILDILKEKGVKATFFMVGRQAEQYPGLVRRILAEGHEIGNHTYTHANLAVIPDDQVELELNATQRLLESITGRSTTLFRPPYNADSHPSTLDEIRPLKIAQDDLGYLVVMENIDPEDWSRPGAVEILNRVKALRRTGNIVLLHDAGGNRDQTLQALPNIIDWLHERGDTIVSVGELLNIPRDGLMPPVNPNQQSFPRIIAGTGFFIWHWIEESAWAFIIAATALILARTAVVVALAIRHNRRSVPASHYTPPVSVVIAAFNEGKVIAKTISSVLNSNYQGDLEIVVVDDGSSDDTSEQITEVAATDPRVFGLRQENAGKAAALSRAIALARNEVLIFLDADTIFEPNTIAELVAPMKDQKVGAVSGHARVGNLRTFIARCQELEYICGFNLDRRAYSEWDCITVVPGAISAVRRSALDLAGGFSHDTLAEDTDLTLTLHKRGYRVDYAPKAIAYTEAPETMRALAKQRFRWAFGTLQCLWKHRDICFNPNYRALGWFSIPSIWFFQMLLVALVPVLDVFLLVSMASGGGGALWGYFAAFLLTDLVLAVLACYLDEEPLWRAWMVIPMRIIYRPLLSWVVWRAILKAVQGAWVGWGKLERTASVPSRV